jgi:hypothetical protein
MRTSDTTTIEAGDTIRTKSGKLYRVSSTHNQSNAGPTVWIASARMLKDGKPWQGSKNFRFTEVEKVDAAAKGGAR